MSIVAIITARGGSKRIPKKNIREFLGKPIIAYSIKAALESGVFDEIMVSTDSEEIRDIALKYGAKVPFLRSKETSNDYSSTYDVVKEVILEYRKLGINFEDLCCIYPCVPFLKGDTLKKAQKKYIKTNCDSLVPVVRFSFPIQRAFKVNNNGYLEFREPEKALKRSQDLEIMYHDVGMFYFANVSRTLEEQTLDHKKATYIELNEQEIQDIDNESDWELAELKYKILKEERYVQN